ncbi:vacuolar import and degradation protein-domain-containing protein [Zopfochytrium polystomum]|nr:vacuolar import and degradation protein-domain-containing protein [Zopfochytrium polystomum]
MPSLAVRGRNFRNSHLQNTMQNQHQQDSASLSKLKFFRQLNPDCPCLFSGSVFVGEQKSERSSYEVSVQLKHVDLRNSFLCGYLSIVGLTEDYPELCTYFEAEIVGPKHSFLTRKWGAHESTDREHWAKFPGFTEHEPHFNDDDFFYDFQTNDVVFMRWKEHFLVPDHRIKSIAGASFAGFYYIAFVKSTSSIAGYYFHDSSERFQHLILKHDPSSNRGSPTYSFL